MNSKCLGVRAPVDDYIINLIKQQLNDNQIFIDTGWLDQEYVESLNLNKEQTAVLYSGIDWENTTCIDNRIKCHTYIKNNTKDQIHIGNTNNQHYFNYWAEFIRQNPQRFFDDQYTSSPKIVNKFLCLNRKMHEHRTYLLEQFDQAGISKHGLISRDGSFLGNLDSTYLDQIFQDDTESHDIPNDIIGLGDPDIWNSCFLNVVAETTIHTDVFISEKTWKPIIGQRPFVIFGDYAINLKLQELGFDTFDDLFGQWWKGGETWDWQTRAKKLTSMLTDFFDNSISQLNMLYEKLKPRLEYNRNRFVEYQQENINKIGTVLV